MPLILCLITTILFLGFAGATYGAEALLTSTWIHMMCLWLLASGGSIFILGQQANP